MFEQMKNSISLVEFLPVDTLDDDTNGAAVDMHQKGGYGSALIAVGVGSITGTPTSVTVAVEESDNEDFSGGVTEVTTVEVAAETMYKLEVQRRKRYVRTTVTFDGGTTPTAEVHCTGVLNNWAVPFNIV